MSKWPVRPGQLLKGHWVKHLAKFDFSFFSKSSKYVQFFQPFLFLCLFVNLFRIWSLFLSILWASKYLKPNFKVHGFVGVTQYRVDSHCALSNLNHSKTLEIIENVYLLFTVAFCKNFFDSSIRFDCDIIFQAELFQILTKFMNIAT